MQTLYRFFFDEAGAKKKLGKKKAPIRASATAVASSARTLDLRKLLKKLDQNFQPCVRLRSTVKSQFGGAASAVLGAERCVAGENVVYNIIIYLTKENTCVIII